MPRGDKTGPHGIGPMTGRRMGYCVGNENAGFENKSGIGQGIGRQYRGSYIKGMGRRFFGRSLHSDNL